METRRSLIFPLPADGLPTTVRGLLVDYRLLVNQLLRTALLSGKTAKGSLSRKALRLAKDYRVNSQHALTAAQVALSLAKGHRRRQSLSPRTVLNLPYVRRPFLRADDLTFHFDLDSGRLRLSLRFGEWVGFVVSVPTHHREILRHPEVKLKQLVLTETRVVLVYSKQAPEPYAPQGLLALDTNESSLDGVHLVAKGGPGDPPGYARVEFPDVRRIQETSFVKRRRLNRKKAHDRRVARILLRRVGRREHHRIEQRLHGISKRLVELAQARRFAIALEDLTQPLWKRGRRKRRALVTGSRGLRRRLSSWPRRELHRQVAYKAEERGVPVYFVDPRYTSMSCPVCGVRKDRRSRVGAVFECTQCGWRLDRQLNAGLNIAKTVLAEKRELGGLWLAPDALPHEVMNLLYSPTEVGEHERSGREGRDLQPPGRPRG